MSGPLRPAPKQTSAADTAREIVASMGAGSAKGGIAKLPYAVRVRQFRRGTPLGIVQLETVMNAPHLQLLRMCELVVNGVTFYEVWFADLTATVDGYDHEQVGDLLERREVPEPVAAIMDPVGNRVYPVSYDVPFDARVEYDGKLIESAPAAQVEQPRNSPRDRARRAIHSRDLQGTDGAD